MICHVERHASPIWGHLVAGPCADKSRVRVHHFPLRIVRRIYTLLQSIADTWLPQRVRIRGRPKLLLPLPAFPAASNATTITTRRIIASPCGRRPASRGPPRRPPRLTSHEAAELQMPSKFAPMDHKLTLF